MCQGPEGGLLEFPRNPGEIACLAGDLRTGRLVELHLVTETAQFSSAQKADFVKRARLASEIGLGPSTTVLTAGEAEGLLYYTCPVNDGEPLTAFALRVGPLPEPVAVWITASLAETLVGLESWFRLIPGVRVDNAILCLDGGQFPRPRVVDFGLASLETRPAVLENYASRLAVELTHQLFALLTGRLPVEGEAISETAPPFSRLPASLRGLLKAVVEKSGPPPADLQELAALFNEASAFFFPDPAVRLRPALCRLEPAAAPHSALQALLPTAETVEKFLRSSEYQESPGHTRGLHRSERPVTTESGQALTVHFLPGGEGLGSQSHVIPALVMRSVMNQPLLLRLVAQSESPLYRIVAEENLPGFVLGEFLNQRGALDLDATIHLLDAIASAVEQAAASGLPAPALSRNSILLTVPAHVSAATISALPGKPFPAWPGLVVKLRVHATLASLMEPPLPGLTIGDWHGAHEADAGARPGLDFILLALHLLGGREKLRPLPALRDLFDRHLRQVREGHPVSLREFIDALRAVRNAPAAGSGTAPGVLPSTPGSGSAIRITSPLREKRTAFSSAVARLLAACEWHHPARPLWTATFAPARHRACSPLFTTLLRHPAGLRIPGFKSSLDSGCRPR